MNRKLLMVPSALLTLALMTGPMLAQDTATPEAAEGVDQGAVGIMPTPENAIVSGLNFPRGVAYDEAGNLWVAEAGAGGDLAVSVPDLGDIPVGASSQVTMVAADGTASHPLQFFTSAFTPEGGNGLVRAVPAGDSIWLVLSDALGFYTFADAVVEVDAATHRVRNYIDLYHYEAENNPDQTEEINSNPSDVAVGPDGTVYIVDTGANTLYTWSENDGLQVAHAWLDNPVPTSIDFADDGSFYIGFLGQGIAPGAGHIEHWSADGAELIETFEGLTAVTDTAIGEDGTVYAVQLAQLGEQGPVPNSGSLVAVSADGTTSR
jgi:sugar lactone lactonase YvrE